MSSASETNDQQVSRTLEALRAGNAWISDRALRRFQMNIAETGRFTVPDPTTGEECQAEAHYYWPQNGCLYWFSGTTEPFCVVAASVRLGCPVLALVTLESVYTVADSEASPLIAKAQEILGNNVCPDVRVDTTARPLVFTGHTNFAHHLWNEFPGLWHLAHSVSNFDVRILHDPMGNIAAFCKAHKICFDEVERTNAARGWQSRPTLVPGSVFCDGDVKTELMELIGLPLSWSPSPEPKIYMTVRERGRTLENQVEVLALIINKVLDCRPNAVFLLDGFSLPQDFERPIYDPVRLSFEERISGAQRLIGQISEALPRKQCAQLRDLTGMTLIDSVHEIASCHAYLCHAGTMQHKPGWFYSLPGVQHGNRASISTGSLRWTASMVEGAMVPEAVASNFVEDLGFTGTLQSNPRNRDYRLTDREAAVEDIFARLLRMLLPNE